MSHIWAVRAVVYALSDRCWPPDIRKGPSQSEKENERRRKRKRGERRKRERERERERERML